MKVGDVFTQVDFGKKVNYRVLKVNADGTYISEMCLGVVEAPIEDVVEEIKKPKAESKPATKKPVAKKK